MNDYSPTLDCYESRICYEKATMTQIHKICKNVNTCIVMKIVRYFIKHKRPLKVLILERKKMIIFVGLVMLMKCWK